MTTDLPPHGFSHLQDQPDAQEDVLVVDFDTLSVIDGVVSNVSAWGCRLTSSQIGEVYKSIGIRPNGCSKLTKAHVTSVKGEDAAVLFSKHEEKTLTDKRREKRNNVSIAVKISDLDGITEISGMIVDAGNNGCRITAKGLSALPNEVLLTMKNFDKPVVAEFAWRNDTSAGMRLLWDRTLETSGVEEMGAIG
ncbi:PilZ domain-containing protein [Rhodobacterales bacterium]|nr:PilZ domain-containing protein [Rhodobacterales bacterium]